MTVVVLLIPVSQARAYDLEGSVYCAKGGVLLAGTSFVEAYYPNTSGNSSCHCADHKHHQPLIGACSYGCILKGHNAHEWYGPSGNNCGCCDDQNSDRCDDY